MALMCGAEEKHAAETKTKGVVGQTGNSKPIAPRARNKKPIAISIIVFMRKSPPALYDNRSYY